MDDNLSCPVCLGDYDTGTHIPVLLPACGHTFCFFCIDQLYWQNKRACPECRKNNAVQRASSLPVNYSLLGIAQARQQKSTQQEAVLPPSPPRSGRPPSPPRSGRPQKPPPSESPPMPRPPSQVPTSRPSPPVPTSRPSPPVPISRPSPPVPTPRVTSSLSVDRVCHSSSPPVSSSLLSSSPPIARARRSGSTNSVSSLCSSYVSGVRARPPLSTVRRSRSQQAPADVSDLTSSLSRLQVGPGRRPQHSPHRTQPRDHKTLQEELDFQMAVHLTFCKDASHRHDDHTGPFSRCWHYPQDQDLQTVFNLARTHQD